MSSCVAGKMPNREGHDWMGIGSEITIRAAAGADAPDVARLIRLMLKEMALCGGHPVCTDEAEWDRFRAQICHLIGERGQLFLVGQEEGAPSLPVGLAQASVVGREGVFVPARVLHVHALYVNPGHRRRGIGRALLQAVIGWGRAQGCTQAELNVLVRNPSRSLYQRIGFQPLQTEMVLDL